MDSNSFLLKLGASLAPLIALGSLGQSVHAQTPKFFCSMSRDGTGPATFVNTSRYGNLELIRWQDGTFAPPYTPQRRCEDVSARFQKFYDNGTLEYVRTATVKGQPVLCVATYKGGPCLSNGVLITLRQGQKPRLILEQMKNSQALATGNPIVLSEDGALSVINGESYLDLTIFSGPEKRSPSTPPSATPDSKPIWKE